MTSKPTDTSPEGVQSLNQAVAGGTEDEEGQFPYVIELHSAGQRCSGILITPTMVLTAAHCFVPAKEGKYCFGVAYSPESFPALEEDVSFNESWAAPKLDVLPGFSFSHTYKLERNGQLHYRPVITKHPEWMSFCDKDGPSTDLALIELDHRVPLSVIKPMHVPLLGYPRCDDADDGFGFDGMIIGFGDWNCPLGAEGGHPRRRTYASSGGWERETDRPTFPTAYLPLTGLCVTQDLPGALYSNTWTLGAAGNYYGACQGDSGGALVSDGASFLEALPSASRVGNSLGRALCGVTSRFYTVGPQDICPVFLPGDGVLWMGSDHAAVDGANGGWLAQHVIAPDGMTFKGECFAGDASASGVTELRDQDTDDDLIPDQCDACPSRYDAGYDTSTTPDSDGDGVPDRCDNCAGVANPFAIVSGPDGFRRVQPDDDGDGYGNACDTCPYTDQVAAPAGQRFTDYAACTTDADCGPQCPRWVDEELVWEAANRCIEGDSRSDAEVGAGVRVTGHCARPVDLDCDGTGELCDLCPGDGSSQQKDEDGDGIGNGCDNCPGGTARDGLAHQEDWNPACDWFANDRDAPCRALHPKSKCLPPHPGPQAGAGAGVSRCTLSDDDDGDGLGQACDSCKLTANVDGSWEWASQPNCNQHQELAQGVAYPYVGDACDRNPCTRISDAWTWQTGREWVQIADESYLLPPWGQGEHYGPAFGIDYPAGHHAFAPGGGPPLATTGARFCFCGSKNAFGLPDPTQCHREQVCPIGSEHYDPENGAGWEIPSVLTWPYDGDMAPPFLPGAEVSDMPMSDPIPEDSLLQAFNAKRFKPALASAEAPTQTDIWWRPGPDRATWGAGKTRNGQFLGLLWNHVTWVSHLRPSEADAAGKFTPYSNHYLGGLWGRESHRVPAPDFHKLMPVSPDIYGYDFYSPRWPGRPCLVCGLVAQLPEKAILGLDPLSGRLHLRGVDADFDITEQVTGLAREALADVSLRWLAASEPQGALRRDAAFGAALTPDGTRVAAMLGLRDGLVDRLEFPAGSPEATHTEGVREPARSPLAARQRFGAALAGNTRSVFVVGGLLSESGAPARDLWRFDADAQSWTSLPLRGARPEAVLASVYRREDHALYVVDEISGRFGLAWARLLRLDLGTFEAKELGRWLRHKAFDRVVLSNAPNGKLLLAGSSSARKTFVGVELAPSRAGLFGLLELAFQGRGVLVEPPLHTERGLTLAVEDALGFRSLFVEAARLRSRSLLPTAWNAKVIPGVTVDGPQSPGGAL